MWTGTSMTLGESLIASAMGFSIVFLRELLKQKTLIIVELGRNLHDYVNQQITSLAIAVEVRHTKITQCDDVVWLAPGRHLHHLLAIERVYLQFVPKRRPSHWHLNPTMQIVTVAGEGIVLHDADVDVQVAGNTTVLAHLTLIGQTQTTVISHAGRYGYAHIARVTHTSVAKAGLAGIIDDRAVPFATFAGSGGHHLSEHGSHHALRVTLAMAVRALRRLSALLASRAGAFLA